MGGDTVMTTCLADSFTDTDDLREFVSHRQAAAFSRLVNRHIDMVYFVCRRELGDAHLAEDASQAVFILLAKKADSLRGGSSLTGWLYQAARLCAHNARRAVRRRSKYETEAASQRPETMTAQTPAIEQEEMEQAVHAGLARLNHREREVLLMRYFEKRSLRNVGVQLGVSEEAAKHRVARAVRKLGDVMRTSRAGGDQAAGAGSTAALAVALPVWLEGGIAAAPAHLGAAAVEAVLAAGPAHAAALTIAKTAAAASTPAKIFTVAMVLAFVLASVAAFVVVWKFMNADQASTVVVNNQPQPAQPVPATSGSDVPAPPPPAAATPLACLQLFSQREKAMDIAGMESFLIEDGSDTTQITHHTFRAELAEMRLANAMRSAFGNNVAVYHIWDITTDKIVDALLMWPGAIDLSVDGDSAWITVHIPPALKQVVAAWDGARIHLQRDPSAANGKGSWKVNLGAATQFIVYLPNKGWLPASDVKQSIQYVDAQINAADQVIKEIESHKLTRPQAVGPRFDQIVIANLGNNPLRGITSTPPPAATQPTTQQ
jgi:RNA polymerase sigma factor (sigma-70 family)